MLQMCVLTGTAADSWHSLSLHHTLCKASILGLYPTPMKSQSANEKKKKTFSPHTYCKSTSLTSLHFSPLSLLQCSNFKRLEASPVCD